MLECVTFPLKRWKQHFDSCCLGIRNATQTTKQFRAQHGGCRLHIMYLSCCARDVSFAQQPAWLMPWPILPTTYIHLRIYHFWFKSHWRRQGVKDRFFLCLSLPLARATNLSLSGLDAVPLYRSTHPTPGKATDASHNRKGQPCPTMHAAAPAVTHVTPS